MADNQIRASKRAGNRQWKNIYGVDRGYTGRVDRAKERGQFTEPGTKPNPRNEAKIAERKAARKAALA
jgi:hypothetical protein